MEENKLHTGKKNKSQECDTKGHQKEGKQVTKKTRAQKCGRKNNKKDTKRGHKKYTKKGILKKLQKPKNTIKRATKKNRWKQKKVCQKKDKGDKKESQKNKFTKKRSQ